MKSSISPQAFLLVMTSGRMPLAFCGERPGILLNVLWYTGYPPTAKNYLAENVSYVKLRSHILFPEIKMHHIDIYCLLFVQTFWVKLQESYGRNSRTPYSVLAKWNHQTDSKILCICTKFPCLFACLEEWDISDILDKRRKDFYSGAHKTVYGKSAMNGNNDFSIYKLKMKFSLVRRLFSNPPLQDDILEFILKKLYGWKIRQFMEIGRDPQLVCVFFLLSAVSLEWGTITSLCLVVTSS